MKKTLFFIVTMSMTFGGNSPLTFFPQISANYYSSGSIHHTSPSGHSSLTSFGLGAEKSEGPLTISGLFQFTSAQNLDFNSTYINPDLNIEMNRGYIDSDNTWFESSNLKVEYSIDSFNASFGKFNTFWGNGHSSLIISNNIPSYPQAGFSWKISNSLTLEYLLGSLSSKIVDSSSSDLYDNVGSRNTFFSRSIAAHRFIWEPFPFLTFNAMETVIYGDRTIDVHYLLPFIPFWSMQHYTGDIDNVQMCGEVIFHLKQNWNIYGSLFVDEWRPEWTFDETNRNWFGYQIGASGKDFLRPHDQLQIEYTWTDHRIYRHRFPINDSYSYNYSLGFWAGPHAEESYLSYIFPINEIEVNSFISFIKRGELTGQMLEDQYIENQENYDIYNRYNGETESRTMVSLECKKGIFNDKVFIRIGGEWIDWENAGFDPYLPETPGKDISKFSVVVGVSAVTPILFD